MKYLLDTNVCSAHLRGIGKVYDRVQQHYEHLCISAITVGELIAWGYRSGPDSVKMHTIQRFLSAFPVLDVNSDVGATFGRLHYQLRSIGWSRPGLDLLIAATAITHDLILVTRNSKDFERIPDLQLDDWQSA